MIHINAEPINFDAIVEAVEEMADGLLAAIQLQSPVFLTAVLIIVAVVLVTGMVFKIRGVINWALGVMFSALLVFYLINNAEKIVSAVFQMMGGG